MAKDDYFVIAYRILAHLYECLKNGGEPEPEIISYQALEIRESYWAGILTELHEKGYIRGKGFTPLLSGKVPIEMRSLRITQDGIEFMQENSMMTKAKEVARNLLEFIPGLLGR